MSIILFFIVQTHQKEQVLFNLTIVSNERITAIQAEIDAITENINSIAELHTIMADIAQETFASYAKALFAHKRQIGTLIWSPRISADSRGHYEQQRSDDTARHIVDYPPINYQNKAASRSEYLPVAHIIGEYIPDNLINVDLLTMPRYARIMQTIHKERKIINNGVIRLAEKVGLPLALEIIKPLHLTSIQPNATLQRKHLHGVILSWIEIGAMVENALNRHANKARGLDIYMFGHTVNMGRQRLYFHPSRAHSDIASPQPYQQLVTELHITRTLNFAGYPLELVITPIPGRFALEQNFMPWLTLLTTLALTAMLVFYFYTLNNQRHKIKNQVTERTQELKQHHDLLTAISHAQSQFIEDVTPQELFDSVLKNILHLSNSHHGFIGAILYKGDGTPYLEIYASTNIVWDNESGTFHAENTTQGMELDNLNTLFSVALLTGELVIAGDPEHDPHREDTDEDHPPLDAFMGIPVYHSSKLLGMIGLGDRSSCYSKALVTFLEPLITSCGNIFSAHFQETQRKTITQALSQSEAHIRAIVDTVIDGIITINNQGIIETLNPAAESIFGYKKEEVIGNNINMLMPEPYHSEHDGYVRNYLDNGEAKIIGIGREVTGLRKNGTTFPMDLAVSEMKIGTRKFTGIIRDVTKRKTNERILCEILATQQAILDNANFSIISTDTHGIIKTFNQGAQHMVGYEEDEVVDKATLEMLHDKSEVFKRSRKLSQELGYEIIPGFETFVAKARRGLTDEQEWTYIHKTGKRIPVLLSVTAIRDSEDNITGFLNIGHDITERKKVDRMKDEFISTVSHELRTPLTSIRGSLGLLTGGAVGELDEQMSSLLKIADKNTERLLLLINDILDINKIESGNIPFSFSPIEVTPFLEQAVNDNKSYGNQYNVTFKISRRLDDTQIFADKNRLMQVMSNLLSNAAKFSPTGGIVEVSAARQGSIVRISISDYGSGIPEAFRTKIFEKFTQADASDTRKISGSGLGMSITRAIVERHGGRIDFVSKQGIGTTFYFDLPANFDKSSDPEFNKSFFMDTESLKPILICEDDPDIATLLKMMLARAGYNADIAENAAQAKSLLREKTYMAMTLDIMLPDQNGIPLLKALRENKHTQNLPVVVISARADTAKHEINGGGAAIIDWLDKPIDPERLLTALDNAVKLNDHIPRVLHVEDDLDMQRIVALELHGQVDFSSASTLSEAKNQLAEKQFDLVILDINLPDGSGLELLDTIGQCSPPPHTMVFSAEELDPSISGKVDKMLVKSNTTNQELINAICAYFS